MLVKLGIQLTTRTMFTQHNFLAATQFQSHRLISTTSLYNWIAMSMFSKANRL